MASRGYGIRRTGCGARRQTSKATPHAIRARTQPLTFSREWGMGVHRPHAVAAALAAEDHSPPREADLIDSPVQMPFAMCWNGDAARDYDIVGVGQAVVDYCSCVHDDVLTSLDVDKGGRRVLRSVEERSQALATLDGYPSQVSAGGSLANTLVALARLGSSGAALRPLKVGMAGCIGADALGSYFQQTLADAGVRVIGTPAPGAQTGTVLVLSTPDAQRSFLSFFSGDGLHIDAELEAAARRSQLLVLEGYLWELPGAAEALLGLAERAKAAGTRVAMTAGDASVMARNSGAILDAARAGLVDLLFMNAAEAAELVAAQERGHDSSNPSANASSHAGPASSAVHASPGAAARALARDCPMVVVTDGSHGSYIAVGGELLVVPPCWRDEPPVDTCGAGDAYAAGLLYGLCQGLAPHALGAAAARTASAVIARHGPQLSEADAERVAHAVLRLGLPTDMLAMQAQRTALGGGTTTGGGAATMVSSGM